MKKRLAGLGLVLILVGGLIYYFGFRTEETTPDRLRVSGNIEITDVALSSKIPGRVVSRPVSEGEMVAAGEEVALLDTSDLGHEVALKEAELAAAEARLEELETGYRVEEVRQARAAVERARAEFEKAREDYNRQQELYQAKVISERKYEEAAAANQVARSALQEAEEKLALLVKGYRPEQIRQARAQAEQARESLALAQVKLGDATIRSPVAGLVLAENIEAGEYVQPGTPIITVGKMDEVWLRAYINENDLGRVKVGQPALVSTDTYPGRSYEGRVSFISSEAEFTPKQVQTQEERVRLVYRIKITVPNPEQELKPGMPADGVIQLDHGGL